MPTIAYFLSTTGNPVDEDHALWHRPLPSNRMPGAGASDGVDIATITYGRYFSSIFDFCAASGWDRILNAAAHRLNRPVVAADLKQISVFLEKHGAYYHPSRVQVSLSDRTLSFVVNVAASLVGRQTLPGEVKALNRLAVERPFGWIPKVYDAVFDDLPMVLGDWFDDFHEFHLSRKPGSDELAVTVWNGAEPSCLLSANRTADLYRSAAMILTACYDPISTCHIFPWHHAAGDFVIRTTGERLSLRLITVRDYLPIADSTAGQNSERALLDVLLLFFIHLSVRMRLDRLDGVGDVVWAPESCLAPLIEGFFQGLDLTARMSGFPETFPGLFRHYFNRHDPVDLISTAQHTAASMFDRRSEESRLSKIHIERHMHRIRRILAA